MQTGKHAQIVSSLNRLRAAGRIHPRTHPIRSSIPIYLMINMVAHISSPTRQ